MDVIINIGGKEIQIISMRMKMDWKWVQNTNYKKISREWWLGSDRSYRCFIIFNRSSKIATHVFFWLRIIMADHAIFLEVGTQPWYSIEGITEDGTHF